MSLAVAPETLPALPERTQAVCSTAMERVYNDAGTDFHWVAEGGPVGSSGSTIPGVETASEWLEWLAVNDVATYSVMAGSFATVLAPWQHLHTPAPAPAFTGEVPECHGAPMQAGERAWVCQVDSFHV